MAEYAGTGPLVTFARNFCAQPPAVTPEAGSLHRTAMTQPGVYWMLDAPFVRIQFLSYRSPGSPATRDAYTNAVSQTSSVRLDWRGNRNAPRGVRGV